MCYAPCLQVPMDNGNGCARVSYKSFVTEQCQRRMNSDDNREQDKNDATTHSSDVLKGYVLNRTSGLYEPRTRYEKSQIEQCAAGQSKKKPLFLSIAPDWWGIVIPAIGLAVSILTLG